MKLTNAQIASLCNSGFSCLKYAALNNMDAMSVYRLRHEIVRLTKEFDESRNELVADMWEDKTLLIRAKEYEISKRGMTAEEYKTAIDANMPKIQPLLAEISSEEKDIPVKPISFDSWLQLLKDNPFLAGWEETLSDFIVIPE